MPALGRDASFSLPGLAHHVRQAFGPLAHLPGPLRGQHGLRRLGVAPRAQELQRDLHLFYAGTMINCVLDDLEKLPQGESGAQALILEAHLALVDAYTFSREIERLTGR